MPAALWTLGACLLALAGARAIQFVPMLLPPCGLRTLTGIPCPFCGSTRALIALSHFDLAHALRYNPLVALGAVAVSAWLILQTLDWWRETDWTGRVLHRLGRRPWLAVLLAAALANWIYLMLCLPK